MIVIHGIVAFASAFSIGELTALMLLAQQLTWHVRCTCLIRPMQAYLMLTQLF
jgi:hypothetical protein